MKQTLQLRILTVIIGVLMPLFAQAQAIFSNDIADANPQTSNPYTTGQVVVPNLTASGIGRGSGIAANSGSGRYNTTGWTPSATAPVSDEYFEFILTPASGYKINFTALQLTAQKSNTGPATGDLRSSLDNYASSAGTFTFTNPASSSTVSLSATQFQNVTTAITFRIYGYGTPSNGASGTASINDFAFTGSVVAAALNAPVATAATNITSNSFTANWNTVPGANSYRIDVSTDIAFANILETYDDWGVSGQSLTINLNVSPSTTYYYRVRAVSDTQTSSNSNVIQVTTLCFTPPPITPVEQLFCGSGTIAGMTATGTGIKWYAAPTGGSPLDGSTPVAVGNYYASQTVNGCESARTVSEVSILTIPSAPVAAAQEFCNGATVAQLTVTSGSGIKWYTSQTATTPLPASEVLASGTYYATQTVDGCESTSRTAVTVTINTTPQPTASAQAFFGAATVAQLTATGTALQWYTSDTGGTPLAATEPLATGTYYVSQTTGNCESARLTVQVTVTPQVVPSVSISPITQYLTTSATFGGEVTADGFATVTERGVVYATTPSPTTADTKVIMGSGTGLFSQQVNSLAAGTTYYVRAYAINAVGTAYSSEISFTTAYGDITLMHESTATLYPTIQAAANAAVTGDTIMLGAGTFIEQASITKGITLQGAGPAQTIVRAPLAASLTQSGGNWKTLKAQDMFAILGIKTGDASQVVIKDLTVDGFDQGYLPDAVYPDKNQYVFNGIGVINSNVNVDNVHVIRVRELATDYSGSTLPAGYLPTDQPAGTNHNEAIFAESAAGAGNHVLQVTNSYIDKFQKTAILAWGPTLMAVVSNNTIQGYGQTLYSTGNGIQIASTDRTSLGGANGDRRGTTAVITNNQILGIGLNIPEPGNPGSYLNLGLAGPTAVLTYEGGTGIVIAGNTITRTPYQSWYNDFISNDGGFSNAAVNVYKSNNALVTGNTISGYDVAIAESGANAGSVFFAPGNILSDNRHDFFTAQNNDHIILMDGAETLAYYADSQGVDLIENFSTGDRINVIGMAPGSVNGLLNNNLLVHFTGGTITTGDGSNVAAHSVQVQQLSGNTMLYIDTDGNSDAAELQLELKGLYTAANFALNNGFIEYVVAAPDAQPQTFCNSAVVSQLIANGTGIKWYASETATTPLAATDALATGTYYATQIILGEESATRTPVAVTVNVTASPIASAQSFCNAATVGELVAAGDEIKWYASDTATTPLASTDALTTGMYYASQTQNSCESATRTAVSVTVNSTPAPTASAQAFCNSAIVAELTATGTAIKWYASDTATTPLASTDALATGMYYASQTQNSCESATRTAVSVTINSTPAPTASAQAFCNSATVAELTANGTAIKWYASETAATPLASTDALSTGTYYASQTQNSCESATRTAVSVTVNSVAQPSGSATQTFTAGETLADLEVTGATIVWYADQALTVVLPSNTPLTDNTTYYAVNTSGTCASTGSLAVTVDEVLGVSKNEPTVLTYFPNPVEDNLTLSNTSAIETVAVYNLLGQTVKTVSPNSNLVKLDLSELSAGTYLVQAFTAGKSQVIKIVKK